MTASRTEMLRLLKAELQFVNDGGYRRSERSPWRPPYIFEESPSCPNYADKSRPYRCDDCWLIDFVQGDRRDEQVPCRFVPLTPDGVTVDSLYRYATPQESEATLRKWLQERIREAESEIGDVSDPFGQQ